MDDHDAGTVTGDLRDVERRRLAALIRGDMPECQALHAEDYQLITPGGAALSREAYLGQIADGSLSYRQFEPDGEILVQVLGRSAVALRYQVTIEALYPGGHDLGRFWHTDIYRRRDGRWQAVWSQATRIPTR